MSIQRPLRLSAMHKGHIDLGATMVNLEEWQRPSRYTNINDELETIQHSVGLCDISPTGKLFIQGEAVGRLSTDLPQGKVGRIGRLDINGDQHMVAMLATDHMLVLTPPNQSAAIANSLDQQLGEEATVDMTSALAGMSLLGPQSQEVLSRLTDTDLSTSAFPDQSCTQTSLAQIHATILRADHAGHQWYDLYVSRDLGQYAWDAILQAGGKLGIKPFGTETLGQLRSHS